MNKITNLSDYKIKKILGNMSDIVINDRKRERLLSDIKEADHDTRQHRGHTRER
jgi:hypothetical protein